MTGSPPVPGKGPGRRHRRAVPRIGPAAGLFLLVALQAACLGVFLFSILGSVLGLRSRPIGWQWQELIELAALAGLFVGLVLGARGFVRALRECHAAEERLRRATGAFRDLLEQRFAEWGLTPAERDVALFAIKGLSVQEIARLRATSEGTVRAQTAAIYRKAGVSGRPQLISLFIESLMDGIAAGADGSAQLPAAAETPPERRRATGGR
jgi:DNA-binding CsgD family transcriptional regulator